MRRAIAAAVVLLLTASPVVAAACAIACPMTGGSASAAAAAAGMPADCAAMHHGAGDTAPPDAPRVVALTPAEATADCCAISAVPADLATTSLERVAPVPLAAPVVATVVVALAMPGLTARPPASPPRPPLARARRTDILRL